VNERKARHQAVNRYKKLATKRIMSDNSIPNLCSRIAWAGCALICLASAVSAQPANDAFESRAVLASATNLTLSGVSNTNATKEPFEPDHAGNAGCKSLWWSWRSPASGKATVDTFGSSFDTLVAVYT